MRGKITRFTNGRVLFDHQLLEKELWIENGTIISPKSQADETIDIAGNILAPGYIDLQINGAFGCDLSSHPESFVRLAQKLPKHGVTSFLATIISSSFNHYKETLPKLKPAVVDHGAELLGVHLEGPFLNPERHGAHHPKWLQIWKEDLELNKMLEVVKIMTLAPEIPNALNLIRWLTEKQIIAAIGHTNANFDETKSAFQGGVKMVTHLFNAMTSFHHRDPGIIGATLLEQEIFYSLIADGHHLHPQTINLAYKVNPDRLILISDSIAGHSCLKLADQEIEYKNHVPFVKNTDILSGSIICLDQAVRNFYKWTGCTQIEAIEAASLRPARLLGIDYRKGNLNGQSDADMIVLDDELYVKSCFVRGERVF